MRFEATIVAALADHFRAAKLEVYVLSNYVLLLQHTSCLLAHADRPQPVLFRVAVVEEILTVGFWMESTNLLQMGIADPGLLEALEATIYG